MTKNETIQTQELSNKQDNQNTSNNENFVPPQTVKIMNMRYYGTLNLMDQ